jgi:hypothetical protein
MEYQKYGPIPDDAYPHWYQILSSDGDGDRIIAMALTDHGIGDDENLTANGAIVDGGGPSLPMTRKGDPGGDGSGTSPGHSLDPAGGGWGGSVNRPGA